MSIQIDVEQIHTMIHCMINKTTPGLNPCAQWWKVGFIHLFYFLLIRSVLEQPEMKRSFSNGAEKWKIAQQKAKMIES